LLVFVSYGSRVAGLRVLSAVIRIRCRMLASEKWIGRSGPRESRSWDDRSAFKGSA